MTKWNQLMLDEDWMRLIKNFERKLGCRFLDKDLLVEALTHSSYAYERAGQRERDFERLEFLGDAVIELATSHILFLMKHEAGEGFLTRARADLVNKKQLANFAEQLGVSEVLRLGAGERKCGGANNPRLLASAFESVIGAVYLDRGWNRVFTLIENLFFTAANSLPEDLRDPRSMVQEWAQARNGTKLKYRYLPPMGPAHKRIYRVQLVINEEVVATGEAESKKEACRCAASRALQVINQ